MMEQLFTKYFQRFADNRDIIILRVCLTYHYICLHSLIKCNTLVTGLEVHFASSKEKIALNVLHFYQMQFIGGEAFKQW